MTLDDFINQILEADSNKTLLEEKHDPGKLPLPQNTFRSVPSYEIANDIKAFLLTKDYIVDMLINNNPRHSKHLFFIKPNKNSGFYPASSGVTAYEPMPDTKMDGLIVVNSKKKSWHLYGGDSKDIKKRIKNKEYQFLKS